MPLDVFLPQQHQRHALTPQFVVDQSVVGQDKGAQCGGAVYQPGVELGLVHGLDVLPVKASSIGQSGVLGDYAFGEAQSRCYSFMGEFAHVFKTQNVLDIAH